MALPKLVAPAKRILETGFKCADLPERGYSTYESNIDYEACYNLIITFIYCCKFHLCRKMYQCKIVTLRFPKGQWTSLCIFYQPGNLLIVGCQAHQSLLYQFLQYEGVRRLLSLHLDGIDAFSTLSFNTGSDHFKLMLEEGEKSWMLSAKQTLTVEWLTQEKCEAEKGHQFS